MKSLPNASIFAKYSKKMTTTITNRRLGKSDLMVTPVGLGCWQFSQRGNLAGKFWPSLYDDLIQDIVKASLDGGINWFDTAEVYGGGASEKALAKSLDHLGIKPGEVTVATKWWPAMRSASSITRTIGKRINALSPFPIDLYQVHQPYGFSGEKEEMKAMAKLVHEKKIRYIGVSNFSAQRMISAWEMLNSLGLPLISNQVRYSLLDRSIESNGVLDKAKELGIAIIAYSPLAQGLLSGKFHEDPALLKGIGLRKYSGQFKPEGIEKSRPVVNLVVELARKYSVSPSQVALNWLINFHGEQVFAIPGATKVSHTTENTGAMTFRLSDADMAALDEASKMYK
jgi:aryl-alcohol dehydrogenase-like predicted oxidoreductase